MKSILRSLSVLLVLLVSLVAAGAVTFTNDTTIDFLDPSYDGADVVVSNCTLTINGAHTLASLQIQAGGKLKHRASETGLLYTQFQTNEQLVLTGTNAVALNTTNVLAGTVSVTDPTGTVLYTNGTDYLLTSAPQGLTTIQRTDTPAIPDGGTVSITYEAQVLLGPTGLNLNVAGDVLVEQGGAMALTGLGYNSGYGPGHGVGAGSPLSGGGGGYGGSGGFGASGGVGGGVYDSLLQPTDKGSEGGSAGQGWGGAGGGAVQLVVGGLLRVDGTICANGANAISERSGGGSGGSIWLTAQTVAGAGSITADGGDGEPTQGGGGGGGRIAVYSQTNRFTGRLSAHGGRGAQAGGAGTIYTRVGQPVGSALVDNAGRAGASTPLSTTEAFALSVRNGAVISVGLPQTVGSLLLASNAWLVLRGSTFTVTGDALVQSGSGISADGAGYGPGAGPGAGRFSIYSGAYKASGAGYGGAGITPDATILAGGCYGSVAQPVDFGSGGGMGNGSYPFNLGGAGGGAILLNVTGNLRVDGSISANGAAGVGEASGGGSGGSIWLNVGTLSGAGVLSACGGLGNDIGGSGGGGRIAVYFQSSAFTGTMSAAGAGGGTSYAGAGTIYTREAGESAGHLLIDNGGSPALGVTTWSGVEPVALTVQGGAMAAVPANQSLSLGSLLLNPNGWLRVSNSQVTISGDAMVSAGAGLIADGTGNGPGVGMGAGRSTLVGGATSYYGGGGGYGGFGGFGGPTQGGTTYELASLPVQMGSGGGGDSSGYNSGGSGGGSLRLTVNGALTVNGRISADGTAPSGLNGGGGSGGCVALTVGSLWGSGVISANGGAGNGYGGGGGGGRIAVNYITYSFGGTLRAWGGSGAAAGGAGTVYSKANSQPVAQLVLDNGGTSGSSSDPSSAVTVDLTLRGGAMVSNVSLSVPRLNNLTVASNSWLVLPSPNGTTLNVDGNATIQAGGGLKVDGAGGVGGQGVGAGRTYYSSGVYVGSGGAYGGYGAPVPGAAGGTAFGSALSGPVVGSGGGNGTYGYSGGSGGGALTLRVTGILVLDGRLSADGSAATPASNGGGGSGGSIYVTAAALMGAGTISANGGAGDGPGGGGGGGRIFLLPNANSFVGNVTAYGGNGSARGGAGTIYTAVGGQGPGQVVADNGGLPGTNTLVQDSSNFDLSVKGAAAVYLTYSSVYLRDLTVGSNSWLVFPPPGLAPTLNVTVTGNAVVASGGGIKVDGTGSGPNQGTGAGRTYGLGQTNVGSGAGYGGYGGMGGLAGAVGGNAYGYAATGPYTGSGGGNANSYNLGGYGGGSLSLRVTGSLTVDGRLSANGMPAPGANAGGGSGGSLYITTAALLGSGSISANGGAGNGLGGGGGGGRIMLLPTVNLFSGSVSAYGGSGPVPGGAGTIYTSSGQTAQLLVDNGGLAGTNTLLLDGGVFDLTIKGGARAFISSFSFLPRNLYVASTGLLLLPSTPSTVNVTGNAVIENGGAIFADGFGYPGGTGPGAGGTYNGTRGGGGYGGYGGANSAGGGGVYGSIQTPNQFGSGGAAYQTFGGSGGGTIMLNVAGTLDLEGRISANGNPGGQNGGGGSGGSVALTVGTLLGSGAITANGGNGQGTGGGGGGGRIAVGYNANQFNGAITAYGGMGSVGGGAGTVYTAFRSGYSGQVLVDNGGNAGTNTSLSSLTSSMDVVVRNGGLAAFSPNLTLHGLTVSSNGFVTFGNLYSTLSITGDATIQTGGGLSADGTGSPAMQGAGGGRSGSSTFGTAGGGGGYGGSGAASFGGGVGGAAYGSPTAPVVCGSGGGNGAGLAYGGSGGGLIVLNVSGKLQVDGKVSANGAPGLAPGGGGGSGGALSLTAGRLAGAGSITANGGTGDGPGGGGGGGRILVRSGANSFSGLLTAYGGHGATGGGAGTIYSCPTNLSPGLLLVDNGGQFGTNTPLADSNLFDLTIRNGALVSLSSPSALLSNLVVEAAGTLTVPAGQTNVQLVLLGAGRIESGGSVGLDGKGFTQALGPGAGLSASYIGSGAGYGGNGGASSVAPGGGTYGSAEQPTDWGSGGGVGWGVPAPGSEGGGSLHFSVAGTLTVNGRLSANGNAAAQDDAGGGSGGSLWVEAASFGGAGSLSADGGPGELYEGGGGGGGRIAIYSRTNTFLGQFSAAGAPGYYSGQDGSVYLGSTFAAPAVVAQNPTGLLSNAVSTVDLYFNTALNPLSVNGSAFSLTTPAGVLSTDQVFVATSSPTHVQLSFPTQTAPGEYTVTAGPGLQSLFGQAMSQVYTGSFSLSLPLIEGTVTDLSGQPMAGVLLQPSGGLPGVTTDNEGNYALPAPLGSSLIITPSGNGLVPVPGARVYTNLTASCFNQNYLLVGSIVPTVMAQPGPTNLNLTWFSIPGVTYQCLSSTNLVDWSPYGDALVGTNTLMQWALPTGSEPFKFFRLRATN